MADDTFNERFGAIDLPQDTLPSTEFFGPPGLMQKGGMAALRSLSGDTLLEYIGNATKKIMEGDKSEEIGLATTGAALTIGSAAKFGIHPTIAAEFHDQILKPGAERIVANPSAIEKPLGSDALNIPRSELALTGESHVDAVLTSPVTKGVVDNPVVDRTHDVPYTAGGSVPLADPKMFIDKNFPRAFNIDGVTFDPADPFSVHENVEQHTMDILTKGGMTPEEAYRVAHFEFAEKAEGAWYRAHGIDQEKAEAAYAPYMAAIQHDAGADFPTDLYRRPYPHDQPSAAKNEAITEPRPSPAEINRAKQIIADWQAKGEEGPAPEAAKPRPNPLQEAHDLGVIGPERQPHPEDTPAQAGQRAIPATRRTDPNDKITMTPAGEPIDAYQRRLAENLRKLKQPGDFDNLIWKMAQENNFFPEARAGEVPAAHIEALAKVFQDDPTKFDQKLLEKKFNGDAQYRALVQVLTQARDDYHAVSAKFRDDPSPENQEAAARAKQLFQYATEYRAAFKSDWGKTGKAQQEELRQERRAEQYKERDRSGVPKAANDLVAATEEFAREPSKNGLLDLINSAAKAVDEARPKQTKEGETVKQEAPPQGVNELVKTAEAILNLWDYEKPKPIIEPTVRPLRSLVYEGAPNPASPLARLNQILNRAERLSGPAKQAVQRSVAQQFPPELQAMVDKAERVTKRFGGIDREKAELLAEAEATAGLDKEGFAYVLARAQDMAAKVADKTDALFWLRNNWLLSGPITHTFYFAVNAGTAVATHVINPALAAAIDKVRGGKDVFFGESFAGAHGLISSVPGAFKAAWLAAKTGGRVPLESELRLAERGEESPQKRGANIPYLANTSPDWGAISRVADWLDVPMAARNAAELAAGGWAGRFANMQHTLFKVLSEGAMAYRNAYVAAAKEGLNPVTSPNFEDRYSYHLRNPTDDALRDNVNAGFSGTFMEKLGPKTSRLASALKDTPLRWEFPFLHVPVNIARKGVSLTPLAFAGPEMRAELLGERGSRKQALALSAMLTGSAVIGYATNLYLQDKITGEYPTDSQERKRWQAEGIQPYSFQWNGQWVSYGRFGPARTPIASGALIGNIIKNYDATKGADEAMAHAVGHAVVGAANIVAGEVGMLALSQFFGAMNGERGEDQFGAGLAASFVPYNVGLGQLAAYNDPYMRQVKSFTDAVKYKFPLYRQTLPPKRDPVYGEPIHNPAYGTFVREAPVINDPIKMELERLGYFPTQPASTVSHVKLSPEQYEKYQATAGTLAKRGLQQEMYSREYFNAQDDERNERARGVIKDARAMAREGLHLDDPSVVQKGIANRKAQIIGPQ